MPKCGSLRSSAHPNISPPRATGPRCDRLRPARAPAACAAEGCLAMLRQDGLRVFAGGPRHPLLGLNVSETRLLNQATDRRPCHRARVCCRYSSYPHQLSAGIDAASLKARFTRDQLLTIGPAYCQQLRAIGDLTPAPDNCVLRLSEETLTRPHAPLRQAPSGPGGGIGRRTSFRC